MGLTREVLNAKLTTMMDSLQEKMDKNLHLTDKVGVSEACDKLTFYRNYLNEADREYLDAAIDTVENGNHWK